MITEAFSWIGDLAQWIGSLVPRWHLCRSTHSGVKFVRSKVKAIAPGIFWIWPVTSEYVLIPTARQSLDIPAQALTTKDGISVLVSVVLVYEVKNIVKALGQTWDPDDTAMEIGGAATVGVVASRTWAELQASLADGQAAKELSAQAQELLRPFGFKIIRGRFTDCARCLVLRTVGDWSARDSGASYG